MKIRLLSVTYKIIVFNEGYLLPEMRCDMIELTKLSGCTFTVNAEMIETVEETPDTVISLTTGRKFIVKESRQEVKNLVILYKKEIFCNNL